MTDCEILYIISSLGNIDVYQNLLDTYGIEIGIDNLKKLLKKDDIWYINNNECRDILVRYINTHFNEGDIGL